MVQVLLTRLGDTLPTLCWPGQFSSDPINLLSQIRLQGQTGQTLFMASFKTLVFLALSFANVCSVPENDENYSPLREDVRLFVWLSPQAPGDLDPFIPRHNARDHHSDRTEEASGCRNWEIMKHNEAANYLLGGKSISVGRESFCRIYQALCN